MIEERDELGRIPQIWTVESAINDSKKYKSKKDFREKSNSAYQYLVRHGHLGSINLPGKRHRLSDWDIICSIRACNSWGDFRISRPKEYTAFHKRKRRFNSDVYANLGTSKTSLRWTKEEVLKEAKKYKTKSSFSKGSSGAYDAALNYGLIKEACTHMDSLTSDFDCVYVWTAEFLNSSRIVKVGVTSKRLGFTRIKFVERKSGFSAKDVVLVESNEALLIESKMKKIGKKYDAGDFSGSTEFLEVSEDDYLLLLEVMNDRAEK